MAANGGNEDSMDLAEDQINLLEENFTKVSKHPDGTTLMLIAAECGLSEEITAVSSLHADENNLMHCCCIRNLISKAECSGLPVFND